MPKQTQKVSAEEQIKIDHREMARGIFSQAGFTRIPKLSDKEFNYEGQSTDFDDIYVYENILLCIEYTCTKSSNIGGHLKPKKIVYDKIQSNTESFVDFYTSLSADLKTALLTNYNSSEIIIKIIYCSRYDVQQSHKINVPNPIYLDYPDMRYFKNISDCVKRSSLFELLDFLKIDENSLGHEGKIGLSDPTHSHPGSLLPESNSNFPKGFRVVSFYVDPKSLLKSAFVLRRNGWRNSYNLYQRMISKDKIDSIRKYLRDNKRVFVNNIVVTLPSETKLFSIGGKDLGSEPIVKTTPVRVQIPNRINTIGIIDGQHRTYAYYESNSDDAEIAKLRTKQNLLVTGIVYPDGLDGSEREKFESTLFLEINSKQTKAKSKLIQEIGLILDPFSTISIATKVLDSLDRSSGPLGGHIERYFFDKDKLKTTSVVSYALAPLVKTSGDDSLFALWDNEDKYSMVDGKNLKLLESYIIFCVDRINEILLATKLTLNEGRWTTDKSVPDRFINTANINCLLIALRLLIEKGEAGSLEFYKEKLKGINNFKFKQYHSSHYNMMARDILKQFFGLHFDSPTANG